MTPLGGTCPYTNITVAVAPGPMLEMLPNSPHLIMLVKQEEPSFQRLMGTPVGGCLSTVFRRPTVLLGGVDPVPNIRMAILEVEGQLPCSGHYDMINLLSKGLLIKGFKAHRAGGFLQNDPVRDLLSNTMPALLFP